MSSDHLSVYESNQLIILIMMNSLPISHDFLKDSWMNMSGHLAIVVLRSDSDNWPRNICWRSTYSPWPFFRRTRPDHCPRFVWSIDVWVATQLQQQMNERSNPIQSIDRWIDRYNEVTSERSYVCFILNQSLRQWIPIDSECRVVDPLWSKEKAIYHETNLPIISHCRYQTC